MWIANALNTVYSVFCCFPLEWFDSRESLKLSH